MTLLEKINVLIHLGYQVSFDKVLSQFEISLSYEEDDGEIRYKSQWLPLDGGHYNEERIVDCLHFLETNINKNE